MKTHKVKQIYATEFGKDTYMIIVTEDGKLLRATHNKKTGKTVWENMLVPTLTK